MATRIILLQDAVHFPSFGGGNKANRLLMEALAARGFDCWSLCRPAGAGSVLAHQFGREGLAARGIAVTQADDGIQRYRHQGVQVEVMDFTSTDTQARIAARLRAIDADWILISDDRDGRLLNPALTVAADRTIALVHTHTHLPFGPAATAPDTTRHDRLKRVHALAAVSRYSQDYIGQYGRLTASLLYFPVFGQGPFPQRQPPVDGAVMMINPCAVKGLSIFLALADRFPDTAFAAVPTWGADQAVLEQLSARPNIRILEPADEVGIVLAQARILLAPSLIPETFGYVTVDAMLRGIPVLTGNQGGQGEAGLGAATALPVRPLGADGSVSEQDIGPWQAALYPLLNDPIHYAEQSRRAWQAATAFLPRTDVRHFIRFLSMLEHPDV